MKPSKVKLIDNCLNCKGCYKQANHMYKYDGSLGAERWAYYCNKLETYIGETSLGDYIEADAETFTCRKFDAM